MARMSFTTDRAQYKIERIKALITEQGLTLEAIAQAVPISKRWARAYIVHLHAAGQVYITHWTHDEGESRAYLRPVYMAGDKPSAPRPPAFTRCEIGRRKRAKIKADPELYMNHIARERRRRFVPRADWASAWMMGAAA
jgi:hypothetical protein